MLGLLPSGAIACWLKRTLCSGMPRLEKFPSNVFSGRAGWVQATRTMQAGDHFHGEVLDDLAIPNSRGTRCRPFA